MAFKRYRIELILLIISLVITSLALGWAAFSSRMHMAILLGIMVVGEAVTIFLTLTRANREILFFFKALENDDTTFHYQSDHRSRFIDELHQYLNNLNTSFQDMKINNEIREHYFSRILENLSNGLMVITRTGHINQINPEALRLFDVQRLTHVNALAMVHQNLPDRLMGLESLEKAEITLQDLETGIKRLIGLQVVDVNLQGEEVRITTMQDLSVEMERKEIDDWIRLIRVMSHEIMNSLAPITSISTSLMEVWSENQETQPDLPDPKISQTLKGLNAIAEQSEGLTTFFESYRMLSRIPDPVKCEFSICSMFEKLETLVILDEENSAISFDFTCEDQDLKLEADEQMITQVMLNLIKNAVQAVEGVKNSSISVQSSVQITSQNIVLSVTDNGHGIAAEISDEIFMPFFTTRQKGTGVGLSYSRQVMNMNKGTIQFDSVPGRTEFRLVFK